MILKFCLIKKNISLKIRIQPRKNIEKYLNFDSYLNKKKQK